MLSDGIGNQSITSRPFDSAGGSKMRDDVERLTYSTHNAVQMDH